MYMMKTVVLLFIFVKYLIKLFQDSLMNWKFKKHLFKMQICCNIIHIFYFTLDQFSVSLLNKSINFLKKIITVPKLLNSSKIS